MSSLTTQLKTLKIGTRGSPLALWQAHMVRDVLKTVHGLQDAQIEIIILKTTGDAIKGHLSEFGGKGLFTRELEEALLDGRIDLAVHSMKDVPTVGHDDLAIGAILPREDPRDAFIAAAAASPNDLPQGAIVGTASIRRRAQLASIRPDIKFALLRGNVGTRLAKLAKGECEATFLAYAGLKRLGQQDVVTKVIPTDIMLPAPAQGAVGVECRKDDALTIAAVGALDHFESRLAITAERAFLRALDGSCRTPIAALAEVEAGVMRFRGQVLSKDGALDYRAEDAMPFRSETPQERDIDAAYKLGFELGEKLRVNIGGRIVWDD